MRVSLLLLAAFAATQPVTMNMFVPSLPGVASALDASPATVQLTVSVYLATFGVVQLLYGPLSDRFGRKTTLLGALLVLATGSVACALAPSVSWLIAGRALQAAGACGGAVVTRAILRDVRGLGVMTALSAVAAAFAPWVGGVLDVHHGWRAGFVFVAVFALMLCALAWRALPETNARRGQMSLLAVLGGTRMLISSRAFVANTLHVACSMGAWMSVVTGFPHLLSNLLSMPPTEYGKWFPLLTAGYIAGNLVTARLADRVVLERLVIIGSIISIVAVGIGVCLVASYGPLAPLLFVPITFMNFGQGISQQSAIAVAVSEHPAIAGSASGVLGSTQMLAGACSAQLVALLLGDSALPLLLMTFTFVVIGGCLGWIAYRGRHSASCNA